MKAKYLFILLILTLVLSACFSPWKEDVGTFSISFGAGNRAARSVFSDGVGEGGDEGNNGDNTNTTDPRDPMEMFYSFLEKHFISHTIKLSGGPDTDQIKENVYYKQNVNFSVTPGRWDISVKAWMDLDILLDIMGGPTDLAGKLEIINDITEHWPDCIDIATGKILIAVNYTPKSIDIKPGQNGSLIIEMGFSELINAMINDEFGSSEGGSPSDNNIIVTFYIDNKHSEQRNANNGIIYDWPSDPYKEGYTFDGWYDANGSPRNNNDHFYENTNLSAKWKVNTNFIISFNPIEDIDEPSSSFTIYKLTDQNTKIVMIDNRNDYRNGSIKWHIDGIPIDEISEDNDSFLKLSAMNYNEGNHILSLEVIKEDDGKYYSRAIIFTVY